MQDGNSEPAAEAAIQRRSVPSLPGPLWSSQLSVTHHPWSVWSIFSKWNCFLSISTLPRAGFGVVRIDPLRFLARCHTRQLN